MKFIAKYQLLAFAMVFAIAFLLLEFVFTIENLIIKIVISLLLAYKFSPKRKQIRTSQGNKTKVTWIFLRKPIYLN